jgi:RNA polymerase sigma-70 factor (ECF subfamily)
MQERASAPAADLREPDDAELVARARDGDEAAVRAIVRRHNRRLFRVARSVVRDDAEAEDVVQETYVRAFQHLDTFRGAARLSTWLTRIAVNEALGRLRRRRPTTDLEALDLPGAGEGGQLLIFPGAIPPEGPEAELGRRRVRAFLEDAVDELPDPYRLVFVLRDVEEMSIEETALQLGVRPETIKTRLHRARRLMRASLDRRLSAAFTELFPFDGRRCAGMADRVAGRLRALAHDKGGPQG